MDILRDAGAAIWRADRVCGGACSCATGSFRGAGTIKGDIGGVDYCVDRCQANGVSTLSTGAVSTMSAGAAAASIAARSEEHTSELQSRPHLVCRLLLEKKMIISCTV